MSSRLFFPSLCLAVLALSACTAPKTALQRHEEFGTSDSFTRSFPGGEQSSCEAARRALLSQGYVISDWKPSYVKGRRKYQHEGSIHTEIEFNVVCAADSRGSNSTTIFANAVRDQYTLKKTNSSASIGVSAIGSVSLPFGNSDDALVKVASETIATGQFYEQFFGLVERYLDGLGGTDDAEAKDAPAKKEPAGE